jgi:lipid-A-disaccharide synthase
MSQPKRIFVVAGEHSGDVLGGKLLEALKAKAGADAFVFAGVGGEHMEAAGLRSIFPLSDVSVIGVAAILARLPQLLRRVNQTADAAVAFKPDALVIIDSPEFSHPIAKRVRNRRPQIPIVDYVSPSVWTWRPGRARKMRPYVDRLLALLPFEPEVHARLGGPHCSYVGHPLIERAAWIDALDAEKLRARLGLAPGVPVLAVLPGSRASEVSRLMRPFGEAVALLQRKGPVELILPVVPSVRALVEEGLAAWPKRPHIVEGEEDKFAAFKLAQAALAASGTVTLELAVAGTPMVVAYRTDWLTASIARVVLQAHSVVLPNLVLGENAFPELLQENCTPEKLSAALKPLLASSPERNAQVSALGKIHDKLFLPEGTPSGKAAEVVLSVIGKTAADIRAETA